MRRREFITLMGSAATALMVPRAARAQQQMPVIGFIGSETPAEYEDRLRAFRQGLKDVGYVEGTNVKIAFQWAGGNYSLFQPMADEFVRQDVSVLVAGGTTPAARAAQKATLTTPIVFYVGADPVVMGLVASLNRPTGNMTGISGLSVELLSKRIELLHDVIPTSNKLAILVNPSNNSAAESDAKSIANTARALALELPVLQASHERDFEQVFTKLQEIKAGGLVITSDSYFAVKAPQLAALALRHRLPVVSLYRNFIGAGGLMSYGSSISDSFRLVGSYVGRILKGEKPADLPVQQATKVELFINLKTAKALGITVPLPLLGRADEVIE